MYQEVDVRSLVQEITPRPNFDTYVKNNGILSLADAYKAEPQRYMHLVNKEEQMQHWLAARFGVDATGRVRGDDRIYVLGDQAFESLVRNVYGRNANSEDGQLHGAHLPSGDILIRRQGTRVRERVLQEHERLHGIFRKSTNFPLFEEGLVRMLTTEYMDNLPEREKYLKGVSYFDDSYSKKFDKLFGIMHRKSGTTLDFLEFRERILEAYTNESISIEDLISSTLGEEYVEFAMYAQDLNGLEIFMQNFD